MMADSRSARSPAHPSYLELDRTALGTSSSQVGEHLLSCDECQRYIQSLSEAPPPSAMLPIRQGIARAEAERQRQARLHWLTAATAILAAACLLLVIGRARGPIFGQQPPYVGAKGFSSVWIYVKHGTLTKLWDGKQAVTGGDRLRIKVDPAGYRRVEVYSVKNALAPELLYAGSVEPSESIALPDAWEVDSEPGAERLLVVFSNEPIKPDWARWSRGQVEPGVVALPFVLPKNTSASPDASGGP